MRHRLPDNEIEALFHPVTWIIVAAVIGISALAGALFTSVGEGEIVIRDCGEDDLTVWRHPRDEGMRWDGFCGTETYRAVASARFKEPVPGADADVVFRGRAIVRLPESDAEMRALHKEFGSEDAFIDRAVVPVVQEDIRAAVADPGWRKTKGNIVERKLKAGLEYGLKRVSPTGRIWTSHEAKQALSEDLRRRIDARSFPAGVSVEIETGFVTE